MYTAPGAYLDILLEHCAFELCSWSIFANAPGVLCIQICSWSIFDLEYYSRLFMCLEQLPLEHNLGPKSHKNILF